MKQMKWLLYLYPKSWRKRYEEEFIAMLEQYHSPRFIDMFDIVLGAIDAQIQSKVTNRKIQASPLKGGEANMHGADHCRLDKELAKKTFEECINRHKLPIEYYDVTLEPSLAKDRDDDNEILTFGFFSDIHVNLIPLAKDMAGVYKQRIQYKQVGKLKWNSRERSIELG